MPQAQANGLQIEYETFGRSSDEAILLVMGMAGQLTMWPTEFCEMLAEFGYMVIRYDARDVGLSDKIPLDEPVEIEAVIAAVSNGRPATVPYTLDDMAADGADLLHSLSIEKAHIVGGSMGAMVAQLIAADHPARTLSLTSIMANSGNPDIPGTSPEIAARLSGPAPDPFTDREGYLEAMIEKSRVTQSPGYPETNELLRDVFARDLDRSYYPIGFTNHYAAILVGNDRRPKLRRICAPTLVIHGDADPLFSVDGARDTALNIPDAELLIVPGMGHDIPTGLFKTLAEAIIMNARRKRS